MKGIEYTVKKKLTPYSSFFFLSLQHLLLAGLSGSLLGLLGLLLGLLNLEELLPVRRGLSVGGGKVLGEGVVLELGGDLAESLLREVLEGEVLVEITLGLKVEGLAENEVSTAAAIATSAIGLQKVGLLALGHGEVNDEVHVRDLGLASKLGVILSGNENASLLVALVADGVGGALLELLEAPHALGLLNLTVNVNGVNTKGAKNTVVLLHLLDALGLGEDDNLRGLQLSGALLENINLLLVSRGNNRGEAGDLVGLLEDEGSGKALHHAVGEVEGSALVANVSNNSSGDGLLVVLQLVNGVVEAKLLAALAADTDDLVDIGLSKADSLLGGTVESEGESLGHRGGTLNLGVAGAVLVVNSHEALAVLGKEPLDGVIRNLDLIAEVLGELGAANALLTHRGVARGAVGVEATTATAAATAETILVVEATTGAAAATTTATTTATTGAITELIIGEARNGGRANALGVSGALSTAVGQGIAEDVEANLVSGDGHQFAGGELAKGDNLIDTTLAGTKGDTIVQLQALDKNLDGVAHGGEFEEA